MPRLHPYNVAGPVDRPASLGKRVRTDFDASDQSLPKVWSDKKHNLFRSIGMEEAIGIQQRLWGVTQSVWWKPIISTPSDKVVTLNLTLTSSCNLVVAHM